MSKEIGLPSSFEGMNTTVREDIRDNTRVVRESRILRIVDRAKGSIHISKETQEEAVQNQRKELQECYRSLDEEPHEIINYIIGKRNKWEIGQYLANEQVVNKRINFIEHNHIFSLWKHIHFNIQDPVEPQKRLHIGKNFSIRLSGRKSPAGYVLTDFRIRREQEERDNQSGEYSGELGMEEEVEYPIPIATDSNT